MSGKSISLGIRRCTLRSDGRSIAEVQTVYSDGRFYLSLIERSGRARNRRPLAVCFRRADALAIANGVLGVKPEAVLQYDPYNESVFTRFWKEE